MVPRNNDPSTSYKNTFPGEDNEVNPKDIVPCLLHKKHRVVKLVKGQIQKIQEEGLFCATAGVNGDEGEVEFRRLERYESFGENKGFCSWKYFLISLLTLFVLILLMVWISAGPLSNSIAHTPIPGCSFVRTEGLCSLEKKYLLRWSKPEHFD